MFRNRNEKWEATIRTFREWNRPFKFAILCVINRVNALTYV